MNDASVDVSKLQVWAHEVFGENLVVVLLFLRVAASNVNGWSLS